MASKENPGVYSLDQIETNHLNSMKAQSGKINSLNLIGITQRAYAIKTNPPSMSLSDGYEESTGAATSSQTAGGMTAENIVKPGSFESLKFTVETGPTSTSGLSATVSLSGASNAKIDTSDLQGYVNGNSNPIYGPILSAAFDISLSNDDRTATIRYNGSSGDLGALTSYTFSLKVDVTSPASNMAEVCSVTQGSTTSGTLSLQGKSNTAGENTCVKKRTPAAVHSLPGGSFCECGYDRCQHKSDGAAQAVQPYGVKFKTEQIHTEDLYSIHHGTANQQKITDTDRSYTYAA